MTRPEKFNTDTVRGILDGNVTMFRRVFTPKFKKGEAGFRVVRRKSDNAFMYVEMYDEDEFQTRILKLPYCPGDILYVKETWQPAKAILNNWITSPPKCEREVDGYHYKSDYSYVFKDGFEPLNGAIYTTQMQIPKTWNPSSKMPKDAARIFLKVTDVKVERLQSITDEDIAREGIWPYGTLFLRDDYISSWNNSLSKKKKELYGWDCNPLVVAVGFECCSKEECENDNV